MNDDKDIRETKTASQTNPIELPFTFIVPRQLLQVSCACPAAAQKAQHTHLPPTIGCWDSSDDMSADMCFPSFKNSADISSRSKIEYRVRVKILSKVDGKSFVAAEAIEPVQILPMYCWWQSRQSQPPRESSMSERGECPLELPSES